MTVGNTTLYISNKKEALCWTRVNRKSSYSICKLDTRIFISILGLLLIFSTLTFSQKVTPKEIISKSMLYHDPAMQLFDSEVVMSFVETRPKGEDRNTKISFNIKKESFQMTNNRDGISMDSRMNKGKVEILVDGKKEYSNDIMEKYRLNPKRIVMMKNYYQYLWLMPMKLMDPGTIIDSEVKKVDFFGKELLQIKISYSPEVGKDVWYFYFNPESYAMQGYRFYHDESKNDGEYILLEDEAVFNNVRLPKKRTWYTHKEDKLLGTDILDKFSF
jgi:hypothetical protein